MINIGTVTVPYYSNIMEVDLYF